MSAGFSKNDLECLISLETRKKIDTILSDVTNLSDVEKLFLYMKLPTAEYAPLESESGLPNREEFQNAVNWVQSHFEENVETSVPKQDVYDEYTSYCNKHGDKILGATDFGRVMKNSFPGIKARRLGRRNMSKHYYGGLARRTAISPESLPDVCPVLEENSTLRKDDEITKASTTLVCEWAHKLLNTSFGDIKSLAEHLVLNSMVSNKTLSAYTVIAAAHGSRNSADVTALGNNNKDVPSQLRKSVQGREVLRKQREEMWEQKAKTVEASDARARAAMPKNKVLLPKSNIEANPVSQSQIPVLLFSPQPGSQNKVVLSPMVPRNQTLTTPSTDIKLAALGDTATLQSAPSMVTLRQGHSKLIELQILQPAQEGVKPADDLAAAGVMTSQASDLNSPPPLVQIGGKPPVNAVQPGYQRPSPSDSSAENSQDSMSELAQCADELEMLRGSARVAPSRSVIPSGGAGSRTRLRAREQGRTVSSLLKQQRGYGMQEDEPALVKDRRPVAELLRDKREKQAQSQMLYQFAGSQSTPVSPNTVSPKGILHYLPTSGKRLLESSRSTVTSDIKKRRHQSGDAVLLKSSVMQSSSSLQPQQQSTLLKQLLNKPQKVPVATSPPPFLSPSKPHRQPPTSNIGHLDSLDSSIFAGGPMLGAYNGDRSRHSSGQSQATEPLRSRHSSGQSQAESVSGLTELLAQEPTPQTNILAKLIETTGQPVTSFKPGAISALLNQPLLNSASSSPAREDPMLTSSQSASLPVTPCVSPPPPQKLDVEPVYMPHVDYHQQQRVPLQQEPAYNVFTPISSRDMIAATEMPRHVLQEPTNALADWELKAPASTMQPLSSAMFQAADPQTQLLDYNLVDGMPQAQFHLADYGQQEMGGQEFQPDASAYNSNHQRTPAYNPALDANAVADSEELRDLLNSPDMKEMKDLFKDAPPTLTDTFRSQSLPAFNRAGSPDFDHFLQ